MCAVSPSSAMLERITVVSEEKLMPFQNRNRGKYQDSQRQERYLLSAQEQIPKGKRKKAKRSPEISQESI